MVGRNRYGSRKPPCQSCDNESPPAGQSRARAPQRHPWSDEAADRPGFTAGISGMHADDPMSEKKAPLPSTATPADMTRRRLLVAGTLIATAAPALAQGQLPGMPSSSRELWQWVRTQGVFDPRLAFLDVASAGPTLRAAMAAEYRAREAQSFAVANSTLGRWATETTRLASRFADFLGCEADELVFTRGTGEALSMVAAGLDLAAGDEVVTTTREHPAALSPWLTLSRRRRIVVKQIALPMPMEDPEQVLELLDGAMNERTWVLAFSHLD